MKTCQRPECDVEFEPKHNSKGMYCSRSCAARVNNRKAPKRRRTTPERPCLNCGQTLPSHYHEACSLECRSKLYEARRMTAWRSGEISGSTANGTLSATIRESLMAEADYKCTECGWGKPSAYASHGKPILTIDHIDGNWRNNRPENLKVLCYNCHTLTPTFGSLNRGRGAGPRGTYDRTAA